MAKFTYRFKRNKYDDMDTEMTKMKTPKSRTKIILMFVLAAIFLAASVFLTVKQVEINVNYKQTTATITEVETIVEHEIKDGTYISTTSFVAYVTYEVDGVLYKDIKLDYWAAGMSEGDEIQILYDQRTPSVIVGKSSTLIALIACYTAAAIALSCGVFNIVKEIKKRKSVGDEKTLTKENK